MMTKKRPETLPNLLKKLASEHGDEEVETFEKPLIVAVNGYALGGWMRACDSLRHPFGVQEREGRPAGGQARDPAH